jgi:DNA-binding CsgD family transcriptional regulator
MQMYPDPVAARPVLERSVAAAAGLAIPAVRLAIVYAQASSGELEPARASLDALVREGVDGGLYGMAWSLTVLARIELGLGDIDNAAEHARAALAIADGKLASPMFSANGRQALAAIALTRGAPTEAERLSHEALTIAIEHRFPAEIVPALGLLAGAATALGSFQDAARILGAYGRAHAEVGRDRWTHEQGAIDRLHQELVAQIGEEAVAEAQAEGRAMSTDEAVGWLRRARGARKRPAGGWESLTPTELQVAELAAQGQTNPEIGERMFISRGTAKIHLSHIYTKLEVRNRSELTALVTHREPSRARSF